MYLSLNWLREFVDFDYSPSELDAILTMLGIEVESIIDYNKKYDKFFTAKVLAKEKHPNADKLSLCEVDYGFGTSKVVCGAPNVEAGQTVILGMEGALVPHGGFVIEKRVIRKIESNGMICSKFELELDDDNSGIWVLPSDTPLGMPLAKYLNMDDVVFEISITPNRADCLSHIGIAREIAAYNGTKIRKPALSLVESNSPATKSIDISIKIPDKCPRYTARILKNANIGESPDWLKNRLIMLGMRPINAVVDVTNLILLECGQPLHAFDLDKLEGNQIVVDSVPLNTDFTTLDSKPRKLDDSMCMICDGARPIAIGGVMGGENSEITMSTKNILIESAYFAPSSVRKTSKKLGIQSESSYRFERGVDIDNVDYANNRAAQLISELTGSTVEQGIIDVYPYPKSKNTIELRFKRANNIIGLDLSNQQIIDFLSRLDFRITQENTDSVLLEAPSWRVDMSLEIDVIEEIARLYNYDNIEPQCTTSLQFDAERVHQSLSVPVLRSQFEAFLVNNGFFQVLTQNMIDPAAAAIFTEKPVQISNPLGEELSILRPSMLPSMLKTVARNIRLGNRNLRLFEIGKTFHSVDVDTETFISGIQELEELIVVLSGKAFPIQWNNSNSDVDFYSIKGVLENIMQFFRFANYAVKPIAKSHVFSKNSVEIYNDGSPIGVLGDISKEMQKRFDIDIPVFVLNIKMQSLYSCGNTQPSYSCVSPYPSINRDIAFVMDKKVPANQLFSIIKENSGEYLTNLVLFDVYEGQNIGQGLKNLAFSLSFSSPERTLNDTEIDAVIKKVINAVEAATKAKLREF